MKRVFIILLAVLHLAVSSGIAMEIHHCMNRVADVSFIPSHEDTCAKCGMPKGENNCCKDELKFVKITDTYKLINASYQVSLPVAILPKYFFNTKGFLGKTNIADSRDIESPPSHSPRLQRISHGVFRI